MYQIHEFNATILFPKAPVHFVEYSNPYINEEIHREIFLIEDTAIECKFSYSIINLEDMDYLDKETKVYSRLSEKLIQMTNWNQISDSVFYDDFYVGSYIEYTSNQGGLIKAKLLLEGRTLFLGLAESTDGERHEEYLDFFLNNIKLKKTEITVHPSVTDSITGETIGGLLMQLYVGDSVSNHSDVHFSKNITLKKEAKYTLVIGSNDYLSKRVIIDTRGVSSSGDDEIIFDIPVMLSKNTKNSSYSKIGYVGVCKWDKKVNDFICLGSDSSKNLLKANNDFWEQNQENKTVDILAVKRIENHFYNDSLEVRNYKNSIFNKTEGKMVVIVSDESEDVFVKWNNNWTAVGTIENEKEEGFWYLCDRKVRKRKKVLFSNGQILSVTEYNKKGEITYSSFVSVPF